MAQFRRRSSRARRAARDAQLDAPLDAVPDVPGWSRRSFIAGTLGVGAMAVVSACGGDDGSPASTSTGAPATSDPARTVAPTTTGGPSATDGPTTTARRPGATVEITDLLGTRQLPASPSRVVCLDGRNDLELAVLCGFPVVGYYDRSTDTVPLPADLAAAVTDAEQLPFEPNLEQLASLRPDLIIMPDTYWADELGRDRLEAIAPLLITVHDPEAGQAQWREEFVYFLDAFGKSDRMTRHLERYDEAVASVRDRWGQTIDDTALALVQFTNGTGDIVIHPPSYVLIGAVVDDVGGHFAAQQSAVPDGMLAAENLGDIDADFIIRSAYELTPESFEGLESNPLWPTLPAVKRGAVLDTAVLVVNFGGPVLALECVALLDRVYELAASARQDVVGTEQHD
jgi:iron complex transport system substrate-binding protein